MKRHYAPTNIEKATDWKMYQEKFDYTIMHKFEMIVYCLCSFAILLTTDDALLCSVEVCFSHFIRRKYKIHTTCSTAILFRSASKCVHFKWTFSHQAICSGSYKRKKDAAFVWFRLIQRKKDQMLSILVCWCLSFGCNKHNIHNVTRHIYSNK